MNKRSVFLTLVLLMFVSVTFAQEGTLTVDEMVFGTSVQDREPMGADSTFSTMVGQVYCFTRISGAADTTSVTHVWYYNNEEMARVELPVRAETWRTWSSKNIVDSWAGRWRVDVESAMGNVISSKEFTVN